MISTQLLNKQLLTFRVMCISTKYYFVNDIIILPTLLGCMVLHFIAATQMHNKLGVY